MAAFFANQCYAQPTEINLLRTLMRDSISMKLSKSLNRNGRQIRIGDKVPECYFKMVNYEAPDLRLSDWRGKWVILDFWSNGCSSCIENIPRLEWLQQGYEKKLMIIPITFETAALAAETLKWVGDKYKLDKAPASIVEDTTTYSLFSSYLNPLEVWIDPSGNVAAITGSEYVTRENIDAALDKKPLNFPDYSLKTPFDHPEDKATADTVEYGSVIKEMVGYGDRSPMLRSASQAKTIFGMFSGGIVYLYVRAHQYLDSAKMDDIGVSSLDFHKCIKANFNIDAATDSTYHPGSYTPCHNRDEDIYKGYIYNLNMPAGTSNKEIGQKMLSDLDNYFHITSAIRKEKVKTLALVRLKDNPPHSTDVDQYFHQLQARGIIYRTWDPMKINEFLWALNEHSFPDMPPLVVLDKTGGANEKISIRHFSTMTLQELRMQLNVYGLDIVPGEDRETDMLVLTKLPKS
jgi:thiol-disulfide isomerase/thioredoxin